MYGVKLILAGSWNKRVVDIAITYTVCLWIGTNSFFVDSCIMFEMILFHNQQWYCFTINSMLNTFTWPSSARTVDATIQWFPWKGDRSPDMPGNCLVLHRCGGHIVTLSVCVSTIVANCTPWGHHWQDRWALGRHARCKTKQRRHELLGLCCKRSASFEKNKHMGFWLCPVLGLQSSIFIPLHI